MVSFIYSENVPNLMGFMSVASKLTRDLLKKLGFGIKLSFK